MFFHSGLRILHLADHPSTSLGNRYTREGFSLFGKQAEYFVFAVAETVSFLLDKRKIVYKSFRFFFLSC